MKLKNKNFLLLLIVILTICTCCNQVWAAGVTIPDVITIDYPADEEPISNGQYDNFYCSEKGVAVKLEADEHEGSSQSKITYTKVADGTTGDQLQEIEPSVGYALWMLKQDGKSASQYPGTMQRIIWMSKSWGNQSNVLGDNSQTYTYEQAEDVSTSRVPLEDPALLERVHDFGTLYYGLLNKIDANNLFKVEPTSSDAPKVLVDQNNKKYTVGPYKLSMNINVDSSLQNLLHKELLRTNNGETVNNQFVKLYNILGINGTDYELIDKDGKHITFPDFVSGEEKEFYIRYSPDSTGINSVGTPTLNVNYICGFKAYMKKYKITSVTYHFTPATSKSVVYDASTGYITGDFFVYKNMSADVNYKYKTHINKFVGFNNPNYDVYVDIPTDSLFRVINDQPDQYITDENGNKVPVHLQEVVALQDVVSLQGGTSNNGAVPEWKTNTIVLKGKDINEKLAGNVWLELPDVKTGKVNGKKDTTDEKYAGMQVQLYELSTNTLTATTTTDSNGYYEFNNLDPLKKYYVIFTYNGQLYQSTYYKNQLTGGYSNAKDVGRDAFNQKMLTLTKTYSMGTKLEKDNGDYVTYNDGSLTYQDVWNKFVEYAIADKNYASAYIDTKTWIIQLGVGSTEATNVIQYLKDTMIEANTNVVDPLQNPQTNTKVAYPVYSKFVVENYNVPPDGGTAITVGNTYYYLYNKTSDQSKYVDYGIVSREKADLALQKDVYSAQVIINGKIQKYIYNKKDSKLNADGSWDISVKASDELYNGTYSYSREVRKSEYLYNGSSESSNDSKDLQVFVTYRIAIKNQGDVNTSVNEVVDYYDINEFEFDGTLQADGTYSKNSYNTYDANGNKTGSYINSYVGDSQAKQISELTVSTKASQISHNNLKGNNYEYSPLYLTGIKSASNNTLLAPGELSFVYVTFKVKNDTTTDKVKLDEDLSNGTETVGKRNIAEVNGYSTYYVNGATIPDYLDADDGTHGIDMSGKNAGLIDIDSTPGNLSSRDLNENGNIIMSRTEDDTDKAPNIKVVIEKNAGDNRTISGYTYEDVRTNTNDKAVVGNGIYSDKDKDANGNAETKINGVTVQLVELVQNVDDKGISLGTYSGEHIWSSMTYDTTNKTWKSDDTRYYSGSGKANVILSADDGILKVDNYNIGDGEYAFTSIPAGDFFIRFIYGDNEQTVLTKGKDNNETNKLLNKTGANAKSYNGQDYKSTVYQSGITTDGSYNGINGYTDKDGQNYTNSDGSLNGGTNKASMYWYNIGESSKVQGASDAKDVYYYRNLANNYSTTMLNNKAEILDSWEKIGSYSFLDINTLTATQKATIISNIGKNEADLKSTLMNDGMSEDVANTVIAAISAERTQQQQMLNALMDNTKMVAQTGIINTEVEYNTQNTDNQGNENHIEYNISDVDLGLQERPEAQLKLTKEVSNFKITLANNQPLFDTNQSVNNLYYAKHSGHNTGYKGFRMTPASVNQSNTSIKPELLQGYIDDELMEGSTLTVTYKFIVTNVGEVDYLDKSFYYTGKTNNTDSMNISRTNANSIVDYVSNMIKYDKANQDAGTSWDIRDASYLTNSASKAGNVTNIDNNKIDNDYVNREYYDNLLTYNTLLTTNKLSADLLPACIDNNSTSTTLVVSTLLSANNDANNLVYNNLSEIIQTTNSQGRRMQYSIVGNQEMTDQSLGSNAKTAQEGVYTTVDLMTPTEIDADSAQKIILLPPTGANKDYLPIIITAVIASILIAGTVIIIKKKIIK